MLSTAPALCRPSNNMNTSKILFILFDFVRCRVRRAADGGQTEAKSSDGSAEGPLPL